jgi:predicted glutamine amidotransferase
MCGIVTMSSFGWSSPVNKSIERSYMDQRHRGTSGFGFLSIEKDVVSLRRFTHEDDMLKALYTCKSNNILLHHRIPTSSTNCIASNHPIESRKSGYKSNYFLLHNGGVGNHKELQEEHEGLGVKYNSHDKSGVITDSEALLHELAMVIEGVKEPEDFNASGGISFVLLQTDKLSNKVQNMYFGRNNSYPLTASEIRSNKSGKLLQLSLRSEGGTRVVEPHQLFRLDYRTKEITAMDMEFGKTVVTHVTPTVSPRVVEVPLRKPDALDDSMARAKALMSSMLPEEDTTPFDVMMDTVNDCRLVDYDTVAKLTVPQSWYVMRASKNLFAMAKIEYEKSLPTQDDILATASQRIMNTQATNISILHRRVSKSS